MLLILRLVWLSVLVILLVLLRGLVGGLLLVWALSRLVPGRSRVLAERRRLVFSSLLRLDRLLVLLLILLRLLVLLLLHHGSGLLGLGLHLKCVRGTGAVANWKATFLVTTEEHDYSPNKGRNKHEPKYTLVFIIKESRPSWTFYSPHESAESSNGTHHIATTLEQNIPLLEISFRKARLAIDCASIVYTASDIDVELESGSSGGDGSKRSQPHDYQEAIKDSNGQNMVCSLPGGDLFGEERVE